MVFQVPLIIRNEDDVITAGSNQKAENVVPMFSVSSVTGEGLDLLIKFLHLIPPGISIKEKERLEQDLCEFQVDETFRIPEIGTVVGGLLIKGVVTEGAKLLIGNFNFRLQNAETCSIFYKIYFLGPFDDGRFLPVTVQSIHRNKTPCRMVRASQSASLGFTHEVPGIRNGMTVISPDVKPAGSFFFQVLNFNFY